MEYYSRNSWIIWQTVLKHGLNYVDPPHSDTRKQEVQSCILKSFLQIYDNLDSRRLHPVVTGDKIRVHYNKPENITVHSVGNKKEETRLKLQKEIDLGRRHCTRYFSTQADSRNNPPTKKKKKKNQNKTTTTTTNTWREEHHWEILQRVSACWGQPFLQQSSTEHWYAWYHIFSR